MLPLLIGGRRIAARSDTGLRVEEPATLAPLAEIADCGAEDVALACGAAGAAAAQWRESNPSERAEMLARITARIAERAEPLAQTLTRESGRPLCETREEIAQAAARIGAATAQPAPGVVAVISAFDRPLGGFIEAAGAAIGAGAAIVCKPPPETPLSTMLLADALLDLPPGLINVITGGAGAAVALAAAAGVDEVVCAGSRAEREMLAAAARRGVRPLEPDAAIALVVGEGADLDLAAAEAAWTMLRGAGQATTPRARLYVQRAVAAPFADRLHMYVAFLEVGDPSKPDTDLGPLISHAAARRAEEQVARAAKEGARLKLGGRAFRPWGLPGHFFQPTILTDVPRGSQVALGEIRAPVLSLMPFDGVADLCAELLARPCADSAIFAGESPAAELYSALRPVIRGRLRRIVTRDPHGFPYRERSASPPARAERS